MTPDQQETLRQRRRQRLPHIYGGGWFLGREVADITTPLAARIAALPGGISTRGRVAGAIDNLAAAVHGLVSEVAALLARADAEKRCGHLGLDDRGRSINALVDLAKRPTMPELTDEQIVGGDWTTVLARLAEPYDAPLSVLLAHARPDAEHRTGRGVNYQLTEALRDFDAAATTLERTIDRAETSRDAQRAAAKRDAQQAAADDLKRAELAALGVEVPA